MVRIALGVEYDGSGFAGWQSQSHGNTVQDALEKALTAIADHPLRVVCAGRTDAGVHALGQVVHFDTTADRPDSAWVRGVNAHLPPQVAVGWARPVAAEFHARFSARSRTYRYLLLNRPVRPALLAGRCGWFHRPLDVAAMRAAAACLVGEHDFTAFRAAECQAKSPVKQLYRADIATEGEFVLFEFHANAFLHHMIRNLVGSLVYIGKGKHPPQWLAELLAGRDRSRAAPTFDAAGLYFAGVEYDPCWQLPGGSPGFGHTILPSSLIRP
ncbi:MAG: tRNA pseudouridine(38-40) synthase TruA [Rhodocyclaceae bacterium]|nr:tRNA pseudouridine(38-40) synthase TruA [Rhodocyclaceae bacterium]